MIEAPDKTGRGMTTISLNHYPEDMNRKLEVRGWHAKGNKG